MDNLSKKISYQLNSIQFEEILHGQKYRFKSKPGLFSKNRVDRGTKLLIDNIKIDNTDMVLDLGCGYGAIGIVAAQMATDGKVYLTDTDICAISFAKANLELNKITNAKVCISDSFSNLKNLTFDVVLTNPPNHAPKETIEEFIRGSFEHLNMDGKLYLVSEIRLGAYMERIIKTYFTNVKRIDQKDGYVLFLAAK